jgi:putative lipoprotein
MKKFFALLFTLILALVVTACTTLVPNDNDMGTVTGSLAYRERIALPNNARITVALSDVSKMDVAAEVISSQAFMSEGKQAPYDFSLGYKLQDIKSNHTYAISARIEVNGKLIFITDTANHVITDASTTNNLDLMLVKVQ